MVGGGGREGRGGEGRGLPFRLGVGHGNSS